MLFCINLIKNNLIKKKIKKIASEYRTDVLSYKTPPTNHYASRSYSDRLILFLEKRQQVYKNRLIDGVTGIEMKTISSLKVRRVP